MEDCIFAIACDVRNDHFGKTGQIGICTQKKGILNVSVQVIYVT